MKITTKSVIIALVCLVMLSLTATALAGAAPFAYITNFGSNNVSIIDTATNIVTASVPVGSNPQGVAVSPDGTKVYVTNFYDSNVSVINTNTNTVTATVNVGYRPYGVAVNPAGTMVYVGNLITNNISVINTTTNTVTASVNLGGAYGIAFNPAGTMAYVANSDNVSVIDTATNSVIASVRVGNVGIGPFGIAVSPDGTKVYATGGGYQGNVSVIDTSTNTVAAIVPVGHDPFGVAITPDGSKVYVANEIDPTVSVIDTSANTVTNTINVGAGSIGIAVTPDGTKVLVANTGSNNVSVIDTTTNTVIASVPVGNGPLAFGQFIGPLPVLPVANFTTNVTSGYVPLTVQFTNLSTNATSVYWDFGDGTNSTQSNPIHTYSTAGNYIVNLTAINAFGTNSTTAIITVNAIPPIPIADFSAIPTSGNAPLNVIFTDTSIGTPTSWSWNFGDGKTSKTQNPSHIYQSAGIYTVSLTAKNKNGTNTTTKTNFISVTNPPLVADFSATPTSGTTPLSVSFTDTSIGTPKSWTWSFGDGKTSNAQNPAHTYKTAGTYTVSLTVKDKFGTTNTTTKTNFITVTNPLLVANFSATPTSGSRPLNVIFTDTSIGTPTSWTWNFGDGKTSKAQNPAHTYKTAGAYTVSLTVKDKFGTNTTTKSGYIIVS